jgi:hypothetical protein
VADAATTGTLVVVALSGGTGAFLGVVINQFAQARRDRKQREHENDRHERERQDALDDERAKRREDRYVALLIQLTELDQALQGLTALLPELLKSRGLVDADVAAGGSGDLWQSLVDVASNGCRRIWEDVESQHRALSTAVFATYAIASAPAREQCTQVLEWNLPLAGVHLRVLTDFNFPRYTLNDEPGLRHVERDEYVAHLMSDLSEFRSGIDKLDGLLRSDLRLT